MTDATDLLTQIAQWAAEAKARSGSQYVDDRQDWIRSACDQLVAFAAGVPNIVERRSGQDRRDPNRVDGEHPMRRTGGSRRSGRVNTGSVDTASTRLLIVSGSPLGMTQGTGETSQIDWELYNGPTTNILATRASPGSYTATYSSDDTSVATVNASGLVTEGGTAGTATITVTVDGISTTEQVIVSGAAAADHLTVTPTTMALDVAQTGIAVVQVIDTNGNTMAGRTVTASSADTGVATSGADDTTTNPPTHRFTLTGAGAGGPTDVTFTDQASSLTVATAVTVSAVSGVQPFMDLNFEGYTDNADFQAKTLVAGGSDVWSSSHLTGIYGPTSEFQPSGTLLTTITLATPGDLPNGLTKCQRYTYPTSQSGSDYTISHPVRFPALKQAVWAEVCQRFSTNFTCDRGDNVSPNPQLKSDFIRVQSSTVAAGRFGFLPFTYSGEQTTVLQYPVSAGGASAIPVTIPTSVSATHKLNDGQFHILRMACGLGASGFLRVYLSETDLTTFHLIYSFSGSILNRTGIYSYTQANQNERPAVTPAMYRDIAYYKFYDTDPGW